ncbi:protein kinase [Streptomyces sp. NPDC091290]|uniref:serine/threonine protein kinase n=1 Tax=Streptomyces sp. NPDC091290 TaxID=3365990 RepID=UPI00382057F3
MSDVASRGCSGLPGNTRSGGVPGLLVTGRYRLVESIGQGGMGRVWRAVDEMLDRLVAVKEMRIDGLDAEDTRTRRERTLREARATARIDHPHVVRVYDVVDEGEHLWIVMELVAGRSLERVTAEDGPLGPAETARIGLGLVAALRQVHARGVLHRDIKPGNVLVETDAVRGRGRVVLTDFGIAAIQDAKALTMVGMLVGSPDYMAPERISGRPQGPPSDVWSLGATLCAALAGRSPFSRETTLATLHAVLYEEPELPAEAGPLRPVLTALLQKDPLSRPDLDALEISLQRVAFPPPTPTIPVQPEPWTGEPPAPAKEPQTLPETAPGTPAPDPRVPEDVRDAVPPHRTAAAEEPHPDPPRSAGTTVAPPPPEPSAPPPSPHPRAHITPLHSPAPPPDAPPTRTPAPDPPPAPGGSTPSSPSDPPHTGTGAPGSAPASSSDGPVPTPLPGSPPSGTPDPGPSPAPWPGGPTPTALSGPTPAGTPDLDPSPVPSPEGPPQTSLPGPPPTGTPIPGPSASGTAAPGPQSAGTATPGLQSAGTATPGPPAAGTATPGPPAAGTASPGPPSAGTATPATHEPSSTPPDVSLVRSEALTQRRPGSALAEPSRAKRRRIAVGVALGAIVVSGAVVAGVLLNGGGSPGGAKAGSGASASASASVSSSPTVEGTSRPQSLPPGAHREAGGFAWATPKGWKRDVKTGAEVHYTAPDGTQELAAKSSLARGDLMDSWEQSEQDARQGADYRKIRLERTTFRDHPAVVWEYSFTLQGEPWHARLLGFTVDGKSYQINTWYRPEAEERALETYGQVRDSFTVL